MEQPRDLYLEAAKIPNYVKTNYAAKEALKTVLGVFASSLPEDDARYFCKQLPEYLTFEKLRGHQEDILSATPDDCVMLLSEKMRISEEESQELMLKIISVAETEMKDQSRDVINHLSAEWRNLFQDV